jgi:hypothetical protein
MQGSMVGTRVKGWCKGQGLVYEMLLQGLRTTPALTHDTIPVSFECQLVRKLHIGLGRMWAGARDVG